jgi:hypothetical protein
MGWRENAQELTCHRRPPGMILQDHRQLTVGLYSVKIATLESLKRVIGRIFKIVSNFNGAS